MQVQSVKTLNSSSNYKNNSAGVSRPYVFQNSQMKDTVSFGNIKSEATEGVIKVIKGIFTDFAPAKAEEFKGLDAEIDDFYKSATIAATKIKEILPSIRKSKLTPCYYPVGKIGETSILSQTSREGITFEQFDKDRKFLKGLTIEPNGDLSIHVHVPSERPLLKSATGNLKNKKSLIEVVKIEKFKNCKMNEIDESKVSRF